VIAVIGWVGWSNKWSISSEFISGKRCFKASAAESAFMLRFFVASCILPFCDWDAWDFNESASEAFGDEGSLTTWELTTESVALSSFLDFYSCFLQRFFCFYSTSHYLFKFVQIRALNSLSWLFNIILSISKSLIGGRFYKSIAS
jgi:hypothetical protein